jgi:hypothetical protein
MEGMDQPTAEELPADRIRWEAQRTAGRDQPLKYPAGNSGGLCYNA